MSASVPVQQPNPEAADSASPTSSGTPSASERRATFRKRRLSLPLHHLSAGDDDNASSEQQQQQQQQQKEVPQNATQALSQTEQAPLEQPQPLLEQPAQNPLEHSNNSGSVDDADEKAHTFRKRRLSLNNLRQLVEEENEGTSAGAGGGSGVHLGTSSSSHTHSSNKRQRRGSEGSVHSATGTGAGAPPPNLKRHESKTMHSSELIFPDRPPPSPAVHHDNVLYTKTHTLPPPSLADLHLPGPALLGEAMPSHSLVPAPKWRTRQTIQHEEEPHKLPFPPDVVGTYSCHGIEPVYDSCYEDDDDDDEEDEQPENDGWSYNNVLGKPAAATLGAFPSLDAGDNYHNNAAAQEDMTSNKNSSTPSSTKPTTAAKINQDRGGVAYPYGNCKRTALFAVYDGHGQGGELVSQFALHEIQCRLEKHSDFSTDLPKALKETFLSVDEALKYEPIIEPLFAGTTACVALLANQQVTVSNAGDSRAVIARRTNNNNDSTCPWQAVDLTVDQNPDLPAELQRITAAGGYVSPSPGPGLSARVWLDPACTQIGLAMARSIGDHAVSTVGVIAEPVVTTHELSSADDFMILASDGVWEFLSSSDAVQIVGENLHRGSTKACQALIEAAAAKWHEEEGEYRDDITAIVVQLQRLWEGEEAEQQQQSEQQPATAAAGL